MQEELLKLTARAVAKRKEGLPLCCRENILCLA